MQKVSVIIPTYRRSKYLIRAIESVLNQTYKDIEIIIIDDNGKGTEDQIDTQIRLQEYIDKNEIIYIPLEKNSGGSAARNVGINKSTGKYIALLDDDDEFMPQKIELQVSKLESLGDEYKAVYSSFVRIYEDKEIEYHNEKQGNLFETIVNMELDTDAGSTLMFDRDVLEKVGGFDESYKRHQDIELIARIAFYYKIAVVEAICVKKYEYRTNAPKKAIDKDKNRMHYVEKMLPYVEKAGIDKEYFIYKHNFDIAKQYLKEKDIKNMMKKIKESKKPFKAFVNIGKDALKYRRTKELKFNGNEKGEK